MEPREPKECSHEYMRNWFLLDCVGSIPVELALCIGGGAGNRDGGAAAFKMVRFLKFFRLVRLVRLRTHGAMIDSLNPAFLRLLKLAFGLLMAVHWLACLFWGLHGTDALANDMRGEDLTISGQVMEQRRWRFDNAPLTEPDQGRGTHGGPDVSFSREYSTAFYWSFLSIMGSDMLPNTQREQWFTIIVSFPNASKSAMSFSPSFSPSSSSVPSCIPSLSHLGLNSKQ